MAVFAPQPQCLKFYRQWVFSAFPFAVESKSHTVLAIDSQYDIPVFSSVKTFKKNFRVGASSSIMSACGGTCAIPNEKTEHIRINR